MENSGLLSSNEVVFVLDIDARADIIIQKDKEGITITGIFFKQFNDFIRLTLFPHQISLDEFEHAKESKEQIFWYSTEKDNATESIALFYNMQRKSYRKLTIPFFTSDNQSIYPNFKCVWESEEIEVLLKLKRPGSLIHLSQGTENIEEFNLKEGNSINVGLYPDRCIQMMTSGCSYSFIIIIRCISLSISQSTLTISKEHDEIIIYRKDKNLHECNFDLIISPIPINRKFAGFKAPSFMASKFIFAIHKPFTARINNWFACAITSKQQIPISIPTHYNPNPVFPNIVIFHPNGNSWLIPENKIARRHIDNAEVLVMFGDINEPFFEKCIKCERFKTILLVADNESIVLKAFNPYFKGNYNLKANIPISFSYNKTKAIGLFAPNILQSRILIENMFIQIVEDNEADINEITDREWHYHLERRMNALPNCGDLAIDIISIFGNILRGRLPEDDGTSELNYNKLYNDRLWMVPWAKEVSVTRSQLITEINIRIVSEYMSTRAYSDLCQESWDYKKVKGVEEKDFINTLSKYLFSWENWALRNKNEKIKLRQEIMDYIKSSGKNPIETIKAFAQIFYNSSSELSSSKLRKRVKEKLSYINPLVIVYASGDNVNRHDKNIETNATFWALYAAQLSASKPGAIVPTLLPKKIVSQLNSLQTELRCKFYNFNDSLDELLLIRAYRSALGRILSETIEPAVFHLLKTINADRIVSFSDIMLDFIPFGDSILGLEYPISRYPDDLSAYWIVNQALSNAYYTWTFSNENKVAILCSMNNDDPISDWANELTEHLKASLKLLGLSSGLTKDSFSDINLIIEEMKRCPIIIFLGHGHASQYWAGLNLGTNWLSINEIAKHDWTDVFFFLLGCETAAIDTADGDLAKTLLLRGARGVVGTTAKVRLDIANTFCNQMISYLIKGFPIDYAFFHARRKAFLFEVLKAKEKNDVDSIVDEVFNSEKAYLPLDELLGDYSISMFEALLLAPYSMTFTLLGGVNQTLV